MNELLDLVVTALAVAVALWFVVLLLAIIGMLNE
jgi:hypothetical protein